MSLRERIEWIFRMGLLVFILAAAAFLSAVTAMRFAIQGSEVTMPNLVGKSIELGGEFDNVGRVYPAPALVVPTFVRASRES